MASLSRRAAFAIPAGLLAMGAAQAAPIHLDAALLDLVSEMLSIDDQTAADRAAQLDALGEDAAVLRQRLEPFNARWSYLRQAVTDTPAHSIAGWMAKAEAIKSTALLSLSGEGLDCFDDQLAWSLVKDMVRV